MSVFVISSNLLMFDYVFVLFSAKAHISWFLPYLSGTIPQRDLRGCLLDYSLNKVPQIKRNSQHLGCVGFFFSPVDIGVEHRHERGAQRDKHMSLCFD